MDHPSSHYKTLYPSCRYLGHHATLFSSTGDSDDLSVDDDGDDASGDDGDDDSDNDDR